MKNNYIGKIKAVINANRKLLEENYNVKIIGVFGSYARGDYNKKSDVDILVEFSRPIGFFEFIRLEDFLSRALGLRVDLISRKALKPVIKKGVLKETVYV